MHIDLRFSFYCISISLSIFSNFLGKNKIDIPEESDMNSNIESDKSSFVNDTLTDSNAQEKGQTSNSIEPVIEEKPEKRLHHFFVIGGIQIALFLGALDTSIVAPILSKIGSEFNQMKSVSWVGSVYLLTFVVFLPLFSKFSDIFGRKAIIMFGIFTFLFGSLLCGVSTSLIMLIVSRAITGIGSGSVLTTSLIIVADIVRFEKRGTYQGFISTIFVFSGVLGPLIGGSLSDYASWRWSFYINLPIGAVSIAILYVYFNLPAPKGNLKEKLKRIDYLGSLLALASSTLFLLAMNFGGVIYPWKSVMVIVPLVIVAILFIIFIYVETKIEEPLIPLRLFRNKPVVATLTAFWFLGVSYFSVLFYIPIYFQVVRGDSAMWSGIRLIPFQVVFGLSAMCSGIFISKTGVFKPILPIGTGLVAISVGLLSIFNESTSFYAIYGIMAINGLGTGFVQPATTIALQSFVETKDIAVTLGLGNFSRILGGAVGVAISSNIINSFLTKELYKDVPADIILKILDSSQYVRSECPPQYIETVLGSYIAALRMNWYIIASMSVIGFLCTLTLKNAQTVKVKEVTAGEVDTHSSPSNSSQRPNSTDKNSIIVCMETHKDDIKPYHSAALNDTKA